MFVAGKSGYCECDNYVVTARHPGTVTSWSLQPRDGTRRFGLVEARGGSDWEEETAGDVRWFAKGVLKHKVVDKGALPTHAKLATRCIDR